jgi:hypothetical protein
MSNPRRSARIAKLAAQREVVPNTAAATPAPRVVKKPGRTPRPKVGVSATRPDQPTAKQQAVQRTPSGNSKRKRRESGEAPEPARKQKTQGNQSEDFAENQSIPDHEKEAEEASRDRAPSSAESETAFLEILISAISVLRLLDQKRAVRTKCLTEQSQLQILLNFYRAPLSKLPDTDENRGARQGMLAEVEKYDTYLERQIDQEEKLYIEIECLVEQFEARAERLEVFVKPSTTIPEVAYLKDSARFQAFFERCREHYALLVDAELKVSGVEKEINQIHDRVENHATRMVARASRLTSAVAHHEITAAEPGEVENSSEQDLQSNMGMLTWRRQLKIDLQQTQKTFSWLKEELVRSAQTQMVEAGILQPVVTDPEGPTAGSEKIIVPQAALDMEAARQKQEADAAAAILEEKARNDALVAELSFAQKVFWNALKLYQDESRKLTEEELRDLPEPVTEDRIGIALVLKLSRTTRDLLEAEKRVDEARRAAHQAGLVDRFPIDQTWDFENRTDDGYADSVYAEKMDRSWPKVIEWRWAPGRGVETEQQLSPSEAKEWPESVPDLGEFRPGDDNYDDFSNARTRERIDDYRRTCEVLRDSGQFPEASSDPVVPGERDQFPEASSDPVVPSERLRHMNGHMV